MESEKRIDSRNIISDYIFYSKYSRVKPDGKKETWDESVSRVMQMHWEYLFDKIPNDQQEFNDCFQKAWSAYRSKKVLGAQRALQYGGPQLVEKPARLYNCCASYLNRVEFFEEAMYLLLAGCGTGFSVQSAHVNQLPPVVGIDHSAIKERYVIPDSIEGWARSVGMLVEHYFYGGSEIIFDYSQIRPKGAFINGGFKAPGPEPLEACHKKIISILDKIKHRKLRPFECHYLTCIIANAVISGGIRRSAMISLFDMDDVEMMTCKTGNWMSSYPELCRCNNSVVIYPETPYEKYLEIFKKIEEFGEPGVIFSDDINFVWNPCCFTGDTLIAVADGRNAISIKELSEENETSLIYYKNKNGKICIGKGRSFCTGEKKVIELILSNGSSFRCTPDHPIQLKNGSFCSAEGCEGKILSKFFSSKKNYRTIGSFTNGHARQYRMIYEYHKGKKPEGYEIDHITSQGGDFIENLQLLSLEDHLKKTSDERIGSQNPIHKVSSKIKRNYSQANSTLEKNNKYSGLSNEELIGVGKRVLASGKAPNNDNCKLIEPRFPYHFSKNRFNGSLQLFQRYVKGELEYQDTIIRPIYIPEEKKDLSYLSEDIYVIEIIDRDEIEEVYDIEMDCDEHNFAIITKGDFDFGNSEGVFVHNCEVGMFPQITVENKIHSAWSFCNLTEINGGAVKTEQDFYDACEAAAILGTFQAAYTDFQVLSPYSKMIADRDALIGVGITGMADNPSIFFDEKIQRKGAMIVKETNQKVAAILGINPAARTTVIKPSGNSSQLLGCASGVHAYHFRKYIRNIQAADTEQSLHEMEKANPDAISPSFWNPKHEKVLSFPIELDEKSMVRTDFSTIEFLERIYSTKMNWIEHGTNWQHPSTKENPKLRMNVSCTVSVKDGEWKEVADWIWDHRSGFCGLSFLPESGDLDYPQAPYTSYLDEKELAETYGVGAILSSGLIVDGLNVFNDIWTACNTALGLKNDLLDYSDDYLLSYVKKHLINGNLLVEIDGLYVSDINAISSHLKHKVSLRKDWVRRFLSFASNYFDGDCQKCANCLKHVNIFHQWQKIKHQKAVDWNNVKWEVALKDVSENVATACAGGACSI